MIAELHRDFECGEERRRGCFDAFSDEVKVPCYTVRRSSVLQIPDYCGISQIYKRQPGQAERVQRRRQVLLPNGCLHAGPGKVWVG